MIISLIAALDEANGIGYKNQLLCHLPADLQHFKTMTTGKPIIMGRKTFTSIGKPLPGRLNIVISSTEQPIDGVLVFKSLAEALNAVRSYPEVMVIGGQRLFTEAMAQATYLYITRIHHQFTADVYFPPIEETLWECTQKELRLPDDKNKYALTFITYQRKFSP